MSGPADDAKKIIIDEDWKSQVEREREELARKVETAAKSEPASATGPQLPPASLLTLLSMLSTQALAALGALGTGEGIPPRDPAVARHFIDLLVVLEEKTKGNLTEQESALLTQTVHELRMAYLQSSQEQGAGPASSDAS